MINLDMQLLIMVPEVLEVSVVLTFQDLTFQIYLTTYLILEWVVALLVFLEAEIKEIEKQKVEIHFFKWI